MFPALLTGEEDKRTETRTNPCIGCGSPIEGAVFLAHDQKFCSPGCRYDGRLHDGGRHMIIPTQFASECHIHDVCNLPHRSLSGDRDNQPDYWAQTLVAGVLSISLWKIWRLWACPCPAFIATQPVRICQAAFLCACRETVSPPPIGPRLVIFGWLHFRYHDFFKFFVSKHSD
jgi:hypothetical protein